MPLPTLGLSNNLLITSLNQIANLSVWLSASKYGNFIQVASAISDWKDSSINTNAACQGTGSKQPTYDPVGLNNKPSAHFDSTNETDLIIADDATLDLTTEATIFFLATADTVTGEDRIASKSDAYAFGRDEDKCKFTALLVADYTTTNTFWVIGEPTIVTIVFDTSSDVTFYKNGNFVEKITGSTAITSNASGVVVGGTGIAAFWEGDIAELAIYKSVLASSEINAVNNILKKQYNIA